MATSPEVPDWATVSSDETRIRVAYTVEQCWHDTPGGTAIAALRIARELTSGQHRDAVDLRLVAGKHARPPHPAFAPQQPVAMLPIGRPLLYEAWTRLRWPKVEAVAGRIDVAHATGLIPCATSAPLVVTVHDVAFLHTPDKFTRYGAKLMKRSLDVTHRRAARVICSSRSTYDDLVDSGFADDRLRLVPLGVDAAPATADEVELARTALRRDVANDGTHRSGDHRERDDHNDLGDGFVLFVGTLEPRKNLVRLVDAMALLASDGIRIPLVVVGADGWGDVRERLHEATDGTTTTGTGNGNDVGVDVRFLGFVPDGVLRGLYALASVFAYPSEREGFGLPVAEAMAQGAPVVTSRGTSTEEVAGGAAVLVDPFDTADIARGIRDALARRDELAGAGRSRARELSWEQSAQATLAVYRGLTP